MVVLVPFIIIESFYDLQVLHVKATSFLITCFLLLSLSSIGAPSSFVILFRFLILFYRSEQVKTHTIYPYVHSFSNLPTRASMLRAISIPDVLPNLPAGSNFSLVAGDFEEIYGGEADPNEPQSGLWDAVMTCFFIDTVCFFFTFCHKEELTDSSFVGL
jgi:hypothetical protein